MIKPETKCFHCDNLVCAWRQLTSPVDGWKAVPTVVKSGKNYLPSYIVFDCPEFTRRNGYANDDEWKRVKKREVKSVYSELAEIFTVCKALDYAAFAIIKSAVLSVQSLHEKQCTEYERKISELTCKLRILDEQLKSGGDTDEKLPTPEKQPIQASAQPIHENTVSGQGL